MKVEISALIGEIEICRSNLDRIGELYDKTVNCLSEQEKTIEKAVFLSELFANYYTCLETIFFRISQLFENSLPENRWHAELLGKMRLRIKDIREPVISEETFYLLDEFRKFRHFKRYYFSMDYDWDRLEFLRKKFDRLLQTIPLDINRFIIFLNRLNS